MARATFGVVSEVVEKREIDAEGNIGDLKVRLKLNLKNTLNQTLEVWVDAPTEVNDFFAPANGLPEAK